MSYAKAAASLAVARSSTGSSSFSSSSSDPNSIHNYTTEATTALVDLLTGMGCTDPIPLTASGTLPRRRDTLGPSFEKLPSSVI